MALNLASMEVNVAIEQVGGQGVYVITGSGRDPRRTSNGQSWADLVTKQKYMLYKAAQDQAIREAEAGRISNQEAQKRIREARKELNRQQAALQRDVSRFELEEVKEEGRRERQEQKQSDRLLTQTVSTREGGYSGTRTGRGERTPRRAEYIAEQQKALKDITDDNKKLGNQQANLNTDVLNEKFKAESGEPNTFKEKLEQQRLNKKRLKDNNADTDRIQKDIAKLKDYDEALFQDWYEVNVLKGAKMQPGSTSTFDTDDTPTTTTRKVRTGDVPELSDVDYSPQIEERRARIAELQAELEALGMEQTDPVDVIQRTRDIYGEKFAPPPREPREPRERRRLFGRRAEMDALGVEETAEEPVAETVTEATETVEPSLPPLEAAMQEGGVDMVMSGQGGMGVQQGPSGVVEGERPRESLDMSAMEMTTPTRQIVEGRADVGQYLGDRATPQETTLINTFLNNPEKYRGPRDQFSTLDSYLESIPRPSVPPTPTPTRQPIRKMGRLPMFEEVVAQQTADPIKQRFDAVKNLGAAEKQQTALEMIMQAQEAYGVSSKEYQKAKKRILDMLAKTMDPKQARNMKRVKTLQDNQPGQYFRLGDDIRGLREDTKNLVVSLFPVNDDTKTDEIEGLYKNAQQQLRLGINDKSQKRKALDMLDLMYLAVITDKR